MIKKTITLTEKDAYILWNVICWFDKLTPYRLKSDLYKVFNKRDREKFDRLYDLRIMERFRSVGKSIERHPDWLLKK
jgi:hypothetical protein